MSNTNKKLRKFKEDFEKEKLPDEDYDVKNTWKLERSKGSSSHWEHFKVFTMGRVNSFAICNYCSVVLTCQSTSTLAYHISYVHKDVNQSQNELKIINSINGEASVKVGIEKFLNRNIKDPNDQLPDYIIAFIIDANLSLSTVDMDSFRELIKFVSRNKNCKPPCSKTIKSRMLELEVAVSKAIYDEIKDETIAITHDGAKSHNNHNMDTTTCK